MARLALSARIAALALALACVAQLAGAESAFTMPYPTELGPVPAQAFDPEGRRLPLAQLASLEHDDGRVEIRFEAGEPGGARMRASAMLEPVPGTHSLRLALQRSVSYAPDGSPMRTLEVDHHRQRASCRGPQGDLLEEVQLEDQDRIVNVPMNLFFLPLVRGETQRLSFELFLCREGAQRVDFEAWVDATDDPRGVRVRYGPDYGMASIVARQLAPDLAFWFAPKAPHRWQGHRLPLYTNGPEVMVLRRPAPEASAD